MTVEPFVAPLTGELLDAEADPQALNDACDATWEEIDRLWKAVMPLQKHRTAARKATMPPPLARSSYQETVMRCPNCRTRYTAESSA